jgi:hypothetical protein
MWGNILSHIGVHHTRCRCRWGGKNSHDCIINFAGAFFKSKVTPEYIKDQRQQNSAACQKICMVPSLSHTKNGCRSPGYFFVVYRKISIPTWKEPF